MIRKKPPAPLLCSGWCRASRVDAEFRGRGNALFPAVVTRAHADGTYDLRYDNGDEERGAARRNIFAKFYWPEGALSDTDGQVEGADNAYYSLKKLSNGEEVSRCFKAADLAHGFDGWLPLHAAAALALDKEALSLLLEAHTAAAATADAGGQYPFQLLPFSASDDAKALLTAAAGDGDTISTGKDPLWKLLLAAAEPGAEKPSAEAVRAAVEADPGAAARPFATPAGWKPVKGALVRLRPGLGEKEGLRAGELATVSRVYDDGDMSLKRDGKELQGMFGRSVYFKPDDLAHG